MSQYFKKEVQTEPTLPFLLFNPNRVVLNTVDLGFTLKMSEEALREIEEIDRLAVRHPMCYFR